MTPIISDRRDGNGAEVPFGEVVNANACLRQLSTFREHRSVQWPIMRASVLLGVGIAFVALGGSAYGGWRIWLVTRNVRPVYVPVSLKPGHVYVADFPVNLTEKYTIGIEAKNRLPPNALRCLLGVAVQGPHVSDLDRCDHPGLIRARWTLTSGGRIVAKGDSDSDTQGDGGRAGATINREVGSFIGESGRRYVLDVDFTTDASILADFDPHLKVEVHPFAYEGSAMADGLVAFISECLALIGLLLLAGAAVRRWDERRQRVVTP